jgi:hypothetical protein
VNFKLSFCRVDGHFMLESLKLQYKYKNRAYSCCLRYFISNRSIREGLLSYQQEYENVNEFYFELSLNTHGFVVFEKRLKIDFYVDGCHRP